MIEWNEILAFDQQVVEDKWHFQYSGESVDDVAVEKATMKATDDRNNMYDNGWE